VKKIAFPTEDGTSISGHLGGASHFVVITLGAEGEPQREQRAKPVHSHAADEEHDNQEMRDGKARANKMFAAIEDCQVLISRGMGQPAYARAQSLGMEVILTAQKDISAALQAYLAGTLVSDLRRVHK
jgi:predicted Fe-Mo cluster-binding NifX family protein